MKAQAIIKDAFRLIGVSRTGQTPSSDALADGLATLNAMLDAWSIERLMVPVIVRRQLDLVASQQTYTIGTGGDWDVARPARIERAALINNSNVSYPLEVPMEILSVERWAEIRLKAVTSTFPTRLYYDQAYPLGNVSVWPVPTDSSYDVALYCWEPLAQFADLNTTEYDLPPGYLLCLRYNLAAELMPMFVIQNKSNGQQHGLVLEKAREQKAWVKMMNAPTVAMSMDSGLRSGGGGFNWLTGNLV